MDILDSVQRIKAIDPGGMYDRIYNFPEQIDDAAEIGKRLKPETGLAKNIKNIIITGMGGSAIGGDIIRTYLAGTAKFPILVNRHYRLPAFIDNNSLVVASSYSGNTEETLSAFEDARSREAKIICITTGGELGERAGKYGLMTIKLPEGYQPRAALGYSFIPMLFLFSKMGLTNDVAGDVAELVPGLKKYREQYAVEIKGNENPAKLLAQKLHGKIPLIYTGPELTGAVGLRWKGQICENAKMLAFNNQFSEFNHNELVGWEKIENYRDNLIAVFLRDNGDHPQIKKRMTVVRSVIERQGVEVIEISSQGDFPLGRIFSLIQLGDFASFYLAVLNQVDPTPIKVIDFLKDQLTQ